MPNLPPAWVIETWKPVGGCKFTGYFPGAAGNSALRFCLLLKWRAIRPQANELFPAQLQGTALAVFRQRTMMQTWSQFPRPCPTLLPGEQIDSLKQSNET